MSVTPAFWQNKRVLITGHTGFKGSWLSQWLLTMGAKICGVGLPPNTEPSLFNLLELESSLEHHLLDIRDLTKLQSCFRSFQPEIVFHLAAQPLVLESYQDPVSTMATNVMGTTHVLESIRTCSSVEAAVIITTDKVYEPRSGERPHVESDALGGHDPYSASKACTELLVSSYRHSFFEAGKGASVATTRAGNVIGGGDFAADRLLPDTFRAWAARQPVIIRQPKAIRPWQHVLDALHGYLMLTEALVNEGEPYAKAWNFGPAVEDMWKVEKIMTELCVLWPGNDGIEIEEALYHENQSLLLDSSLAHQELKWKPMWGLQEALKYTAQWYQAWSQCSDIQSLVKSQLEMFYSSSHSNQWGTAVEEQSE